MTGFDLDDFLWTYQSLLVALGVNGLLALSMYVVLAIGQLSLGQAAFMGLGAYASALLSLHTGLPFPFVYWYCYNFYVLSLTFSSGEGIAVAKSFCISSPAASLPSRTRSALRV